MIRIFLGNVGSGKTISIIKELVDNKDNPDYPHTFSNIITKTKGKYALPNNTTITPEMLVLKEIKSIKNNGEEVYNLKFNKKFWEEQVKKYKNINIVIDEAHTLINARRAMSKLNVIMTDFMALIRKLLGESSMQKGNLTLISQLERRLDPIARDMATQIRFHTHVYDSVCNDCNYSIQQHNQLPEPKERCPYCNKILKRDNNKLLVLFFQNIDDYIMWQEVGAKKYYKKLLISNIQQYFNYYDSYQIDNLLSDYV